MPPHDPGTRFAPSPPEEGANGDSRKERAGEPVILSDVQVPPHAAPVRPCLRFLPERRGTRFRLQILDLATGHVLDELPPQRLAKLPDVLRHTAGWMFSGRGA